MQVASPECSENITGATGYLLLGFQLPPGLKTCLFLLFLTAYLLTMAGNLLIVVTVSAQAALHSPMYFFLGNLSLIEICYTTNIVPKMLDGLWAGGSTISFTACLTQLCVFGWLADAECLLLTVMAYDRYLAICYPLHYMTLMDSKTCFKVTVSVWLVGLISPAIAAVFLYRLEFPGHHEMDHYFCDCEPILRAACSDTTLLERAVFFLSLIITAFPLLLIMVSYVYIITAILRIPSSKGRHKAFSTCSSHLAVVITYFGTLITIYVAPSTGHSLNLNKALSLLYTVATPLLNPIIYTLRNKDIREACGKTLSKTLRLPTI